MIENRPSILEKTPRLTRWSSFNKTVLIFSKILKSDYSGFFCILWSISMHQSCLEDLLTYKVSESVDLRICIPNKFPGIADPAGPGLYFESDYTGANILCLKKKGKVTSMIFKAFPLLQMLPARNREPKTLLPSRILQENYPHKELNQRKLSTMVLPEL